MENGILNEAMRERERLKAELKNIPVYQRLMLMEQVISQYGGAALNGLPNPPLNYAGSYPTGVYIKKPLMTKRQQVEIYAEECIHANGGVAPMRVIHEYLTAKDVQLSPSSLSAYLSEAERFVSDRVQGWSIRGSEVPTRGLFSGKESVEVPASTGLNGASEHHNPSILTEEKGGAHDLV